MSKSGLDIFNHLMQKSNVLTKRYNVFSGLLMLAVKGRQMLFLCFIVTNVLVSQWKFFREKRYSFPCFPQKRNNLPRSCNTTWSGKFSRRGDSPLKNYFPSIPPPISILFALNEKKGGDCKVSPKTPRLFHVTQIQSHSKTFTSTTRTRWTNIDKQFLLDSRTFPNCIWVVSQKQLNHFEKKCNAKANTMVTNAVET